MAQPLVLAAVAPCFCEWGPFEGLYDYVRERGLVVGAVNQRFYDKRTGAQAGDVPKFLPRKSQFALRDAVYAPQRVRHLVGHSPAVPSHHRPEQAHAIAQLFVPERRRQTRALRVYEPGPVPFSEPFQNRRPAY